MDVCLRSVSPSWLFLPCCSEGGMRSTSDPRPRSCVHNFLIHQRLLIRGEPGAPRTLGFDRVFGSIMGHSIIYSILCSLRHAYTSRAPPRHAYPAQMKQVPSDLILPSVCHSLPRLSSANEIIQPHFVSLKEPKPNSRCRKTMAWGPYVVR